MAEPRSRPTSFDLLGPLPCRRTVVEASAGTGKTYTISALITRYIAGEAGDDDLATVFGIDQILVVTFTRAAAAELRDRIRQKIQSAAEFLEGGPLPAGDPWMEVLADGTPERRARRARRLRDALHRFDEAVITTIHGFCQQALAQAGLRAAGDPGVQLVENDHDVVAEVCRDLLVRELAGDPFRLSVDSEGRPIEWVDGVVKRADVSNRQPHPPDKVERDVIAAVRAVLTNAGATTIPDPSIGGVAGRWAAIVDEAVSAIGRRQRRRRQIGYDRLVTDLRDALADAVVGPPLAAQLATRFPIVLVDEFQDTDRVQWEIFERSFADCRLITVGDPKQAIYRFRGADVHAYLDAVRSVEAASLAVNHRSDRRLLDGLAVLFDGVTLGHEQIAVHRVDAAPTAPRSAVAEPGRDRRLRASIHVHAVADTPAVAHTSKGQLESGAVQRVVLADVASRVRSLLDGGTIAAAEGPPRPVRPADIAVLVPSQRRAADAAATLREWGIPTVRSRTGSVFDSEAATQWRLLLAGLATPTRARVARAAGLSWFFDLAPASLADSTQPEVPGATGPDGTAGDTPLAALQRRLATLAHRLRTDGLGAFYEQLRTESQLFDVVLGAPNGDRNLTDLDHVADLLVSELRGQTHEPLHVQQTLDRLIAAAESEGPSETTMRRIETDDHAVHITTIHSAKGLEYPIVLMPFAYVERPNAQRPYVFNAADGVADSGAASTGAAVRYVDVASWVSWVDGLEEGSKPGIDARKGRGAAAVTDVDGDGLRTLYVAMTRARHRLELWWAPTARSNTSPFGRLLLDRDGAGPVRNSPVDSDYAKCGGDAARRQIDILAAASNGTIAAFDVTVDQPIRRPLSMSGAERQELLVADDAGRHPLTDPTWRSWSFTAVTAAAAGHEPAGARPVVGGSDEPADPADGDVPMPPAGAGGSGPPAVPVAVPLADVVGGTTFGTMVHEIFERLDFTDPGLAAAARHLADDGARAAGLALDPAAVAAGVTAAVATPLGPLFDGAALAQVAPGDRLAELTFDLELPRLVPAAEIGEVLTATLDADDPLAPYGAELAAALAPVSVRGWLTGSIDAVFRVAGERYVVVDYKTNRLHAPGATDPAEVLACYRPDRLVAAMTHSHYPLQALLYSVALHRYLRWRLGAGYDPERQLGGIAYLFVRGMVGPATPTFDGESHGVFSWRPPTATITSLDELLGGRR